MHPAGTGVVLTDYLAAFPLLSILRIDCRAVDKPIASALVIKTRLPPPVAQSWREALLSRLS